MRTLFEPIFIYISYYCFGITQLNIALSHTDAISNNYDDKYHVIV